MLPMAIYRNKSARKNILTSNERGNVLIYTLLLLVLLTIIGLSAAQTASVDIQVSGNYMIHKKNFYKAEGAAMDAIQRMEGVDLDSVAPGWISIPTTETETNSFLSETSADSKWLTGSVFTGGAQAEESYIDTDHTKFVVLSEGVIHTGESLDMTKSKIYQYKVFGRCEEYRGKSIIEVGYRKVQ
jgi:Tfp pilus assembly protein PilX